MFYISESGANHGNPISEPFAGSVGLPPELLSDYVGSKGFCTLTVSEGIVTALETDTEALAAFDEEHPETEPGESVTLESLGKENELLRAQLQAQSERSDFIEDCLAELAVVAYSAGTV